MNKRTSAETYRLFVFFGISLPISLVVGAIMGLALGIASLIMSSKGYPDILEYYYSRPWHLQGTHFLITLLILICVLLRYAKTFPKNWTEYRQELEKADRNHDP